MYTFRAQSLVAASLAGLLFTVSAASAAPRHRGPGPHHRPGFGHDHRHGGPRFGHPRFGGFRHAGPGVRRVIVRGGRTVVILRPRPVFGGARRLLLERPVFARPGFPGYGGRCTTARFVRPAFGGWHKVVTTRTCFVR